MFQPDLVGGLVVKLIITVITQVGLQQGCVVDVVNVGEVDRFVCIGGFTGRKIVVLIKTVDVFVLKTQHDLSDTVVILVDERVLFECRFVCIDTVTVKTCGEILSLILSFTGMKACRVFVKRQVIVQGIVRLICCGMAVVIICLIH